MEREKPERLLHERFMPLNVPFRMFWNQLEWHVPVHWHEFFEIALVIEGAGTHLFNGKNVPMKRGSLFLLTPTDVHEIIPNPGEQVCLYNAIFIQQFIRPELLHWIYQAGEGIVMDLEIQEFNWIEQEFKRMQEESERQSQGSDWIVAGALERVLITMLRYGQGNKGKRDDTKLSVVHPSISKAVTFISFQFHEPITLKMVAQHSGLSPNYFSECFSRETGVPFQRYLQDIRLKFAHSLLGMTQLPITEICFASGFGNLSHFERSFKNKYNDTPRQSRSKAAIQGELKSSLGS